MSSSSTSEKDLRSLDEDSGHDSIDDVYSSPAEDRERIEHLETVVTWIRQEVRNLKDYDRDILEELWKIRSGIQDIQKVHRQSQEAERKYLDDSIPDRSPSPDEALQEVRETKQHQQSYVVLTKKGSPEPSPSPAQSHTPVERTPPPSEKIKKCNTLDLMRTAPSHLMPSDDELLEQFFGSDQVDKLNKFKESLEEEKTKKEEQEREYEAILRKNAGNKLKIPVNPNRSSSRYSCDVASEMEQLRARLHETAFKELEEFDKKFSPKLTHPGINPASGESSHSRQGSLDSSLPPQPLLNSPLLAPSHRRDYSLPVYMEPSASGSPQSGSGNSSPFTSRSATQLLRNQVGEPVTIGDCDIRSPTPPLQYGHIRQLSGGSNSSSSGTFSPPPAKTVTSPSNQPSLVGGLSYNMPRYGGSGGALNRHHHDQAPPTGGSSGSSPSSFERSNHSPNSNSPRLQSYKTGSSGVQRTGGGTVQGTNSSLPRNAGGGGSGLVTFGTNLSLTRNSGGMTRQPTNTSTNNNSSLNRIRNAVPINAQQVLPTPVSNGVPLRRPEGSSQTHYSTSVIKKRRSGDGGSRRYSGEDERLMSAFQSDDNQFRRGSSPVGSDISLHLEQRSIPNSAQQQRLMAPHERISGSPRMSRKPPTKSTSASSTSPHNLSNQHSLTRKSEPSILQTNSLSTNSDSIQPYASTTEAKAQMKHYKYAPYADSRSAGQTAASRNSRELPESSWC